MSYSLPIKPLFIFAIILASLLVCMDAFGQRGRKSRGKQAPEQPEITIEQISARCQGVPFRDRTTVRVARFSASTPAAQGKFGDELATMLSNALSQTSCFRVLEKLSNQEDMTDEIAFAQSGMTGGGAGPSSGQMLAAQMVVTGEVTEYGEGKDNVTALGFSVGSNKARVGFIMKVVDPQTGEIFFSESINVLGKVNGVNGLSLAGITLAGGTTQNRALNNAVEQAILQAAGLLVEQRELLGFSTSVAGPGAAGPKDWSADCPATVNGGAPSVMVIIPEFHIQRRIPDPAGETEIIRQLIDAGFQVKDPSVYAAIRDSERLKRAQSDASAAREIGREFGADIVIIGEAFSEMSPSQSQRGLISCRARVEARAVRTDDATIIAADGRHAGGAEITESGSAKLALKNAGAEMADYLLEKMCR